jgi:Ca2+/Na+ antiporter
MDSQGKLMGGAVMSVLGLVGTIIMANMISGDWMYTYSSPFTGHEIGNIAMLIISIPLLVISVVLLVLYFQKKEKKEKTSGEE